MIQASKTLQQLKAATRKYGKTNLRFVVGYTAPYAVYVHENLEAHHENGEAKFLEKPMREKAKEMAAIVRNALLAGQTQEQALLAAGEYLKRESQKLCPVKTGTLRDSAYVKLSS